MVLFFVGLAAVPLPSFSVGFRSSYHLQARRIKQSQPGQIKARIDYELLVLRTSPLRSEPTLSSLLHCSLTQSAPTPPSEKSSVAPARSRDGSGAPEPPGAAADREPTLPRHQNSPAARMPSAVALRPSLSVIFNARTESNSPVPEAANADLRPLEFDHNSRPSGRGSIDQEAAVPLESAAPANKPNRRAAPAATPQSPTAIETQASAPAASEKRIGMRSVRITAAK